VITRGNIPHLSSFSSQTWKKARERIGRPDMCWHDLRHPFVAIRIAAGAHPKQIQEEAGHPSITTAMNLYTPSRPVRRPGPRAPVAPD
jgi:integrase